MLTGHTFTYEVTPRLVGARQPKHIVHALNPSDAIILVEQSLGIKPASGHVSEDKQGHKTLLIAHFHGYTFETRRIG